MAISTQGTVLKISGTPKEGEAISLDLAIKSFPDLGAAPAAIEVTTLSDETQKFIPGIKGMAAMEFVANYDAGEFEKLLKLEEVNEEGVNYTIVVGGTDSYTWKGTHNALIVGGGLNVAVDMKVVVLPSSKIEKVAA